MKSLLGFETLITPKLLVFFYWIAMIVILLGGIIGIIQGNIIAGIVGTLLALVMCRVCFELIMIAFKNNEYLRTIAESTKNKP